MLPQGYVLNRDKGDQSDGDDSDKLTLEEQIEEERALLITDDLTPVTFETFTKWKADRAQRKVDALDAKIAAEEAKGKKDKAQMNFMSGRALFQYNPDLFADDEDAADDTIFDDDENEEESKTGGAASAARQRASDDENDFVRPNDNEEAKEEVKVDADLFAGEGAAADEDVDFD